ncbi:MAG: glycosyltransferase [Clostridia bacterium]|nr:glycosyltransferase [Clostridia bacterium]
MNKNNYKYDFSVIIASYNPDLEKLKKTIISSYKQKDVSFEIIVADDGSKENYRPELEKWAKENKIEMIYNFLPENQGTVKNIISATKISSGRIIIPIAPGDYFAEETALLQYLKKYDEEKADMVFADGRFYLEDKEFTNLKMPYYKSTTKGKMEKNICLFIDNFPGFSISFNREVLEYLEAVQDYVKLIEDFPTIYLSILNGRKISYIDEKLFWYEFGTGNSTKSHRLDNDMEGFLKYLEENYADRKIVQKTIKRWNINHTKNKILRTIKLLFQFPDAFFKNILRKFKKTKVSKLDSDSLNKMTKLEG